MDESGELLGWAVIANVKAGTGRGPEGDGEGSGTRHFSAGTKVWIMPPQWGDGGASVMVLGKHRGQRGGFVRMVLPRRHLTNFRVVGVYSPTIQEAMARAWREVVEGSGARTWRSRDEAEEHAAFWQESEVSAGNGSRAGRLSSLVPERWRRWMPWQRKTR